MTLKHLYQAKTGDTTTHQRTISAVFHRVIDRRRKRFVLAHLDGASLRQLAVAAGISHGSVQSAIDSAMEATRKAIAGEPRYNRTGHPGGQAHTTTPKRKK